MPRFPESELIGAPSDPDTPDQGARANPVTYVREGAPPFLLMHGTADEVVIPGQSELLHAALVRLLG